MTWLELVSLEMTIFCYSLSIRHHNLQTRVRVSMLYNICFRHHQVRSIQLVHTPVSRSRKEMFYLTTHSTHFIYGYMASDIWSRTTQTVREETRCRHMGYSFRLAARVLLYASSHRQDNTYHGLCYTSRGALAGPRNSSMAPRSYISLPLDQIEETKYAYFPYVIKTFF